MDTIKRTAFAILLTAFLPNALAENIADTVIINNKRFEISENNQSTAIRIRQTKEDGTTDFLHEITIDADGGIETQSFKQGRGASSTHSRQRDGFSVTLPSMPWNRRFDPHWAGIGLGFNNIADKHLSINHVNGVTLNVGKSLEYTLNFFEKSLPFAHNHLAFVTGLGMKWNRYHLIGDERFAKENGIVIVQPGEEGRHYLKSRLGVNSFTLPLLFEFQTNRRHASRFFLSAGVVGSFNYTTATRVKYIDESGKKRKEKASAGWNVRPLTFDILVQAGFGTFGLYAKYSPIELFERGKGSEVYPVSLGFMLHF